LSKFLDDLLDFDSYMPKAEGKWPSLKLVFDNLRCYPILALYGVALQALSKAATLWSTIAFWFAAPIFLVLMLACLVQTALLLSVLTVGIASIYLAPGTLAAKFLREREKVVAALGVGFLLLLVVVALVAAFHLMAALSRLVPGA